MKKGMEAEEFVCTWLRKKHCRILARNFTVRGGEIDIIAEDSRFLRLVEVKERMSGSLTGAAESVTPLKQKRLTLAASAYLMSYGGEKQPRFDVACVIRRNGDLFLEDYIENAFEV